MIFFAKSFTFKNSDLLCKNLIYIVVFVLISKHVHALMKDDDDDVYNNNNNIKSAATLGDTNSNKNVKYSNHWLLKINGVNDISVASKLASEFDFRLVRQVGDFDGYYIVESDHHRVKRSADVPVQNLISESLERMKRHWLVESMEKEAVKVRKKRDFIEDESARRIDTRSNDFILERLQQQKKRLDTLTDQPNESNVDPYWGDMWYLNRHLANGDSLPDMNVTGAWALGYSGRGVSVTFLDDGLERNHPDLKENYDPDASTDLNDHDSDPMPRYDETNENKHGTRCAGEVAAVANNSICSVGVAFHARVGGIRMLDGDVTDTVEAESLSFNPNHIDIYSASWGPDDNGEVVDGPGPLAKKAFLNGIVKGRQGLGSIFVWASGNGGRFNDSCACDGYTNSIYTLSISSTSEKGERPWYLEECPSTLATTYSSGDEKAGEKEIVTTDIRQKCTTRHTGTSAAAPLAAGIIALALEANPKLTWRDVMFITVLTSRPDAIRSNNYLINKRGFKVSSRYGFGLMNAGRMVEVAKSWTNVPLMVSCSTQKSKFSTYDIYLFLSRV